MFSSDSYPLDWLNTPFAIKKVLIFPGFPNKRKEWNYTYLSCLLNELNMFQSVPQNDNNKFCCVHQKNPKWKVKIKFDQQITVIVLLDFIMSCWLCRHNQFFSIKRKIKKLRTKYVSQIEHLFILIIIEPSSSSLKLLKCSSLIFNSIYDFSNVFNSFVHKMIRDGIQENDDTETIIRYYETFCDEDTVTVSSIEALKEKIAGYLLFNIIPTGEKRRNYPKISYKSENWYIISGMYILPYAKSLVEDNQINGYLLDTTFLIMSYFDTSIIMASIFNTGMALGYSFTRTGESKSFNLLFDNLNSKCGISFDKKVIETDQGTALSSTITAHEMIHLKCLRHILKKLWPNLYSYHMKQLMECCTEFEFKKTLKELTSIFKKAISLREFTIANWETTYSFCKGIYQ